MSRFKEIDAEILLLAERRRNLKRPKCDECHADCHQDESVRDFNSWEECKLCHECADAISKAEQKEFRSMPR